MDFIYFSSLDSLFCIIFLLSFVIDCVYFVCQVIAERLLEEEIVGLKQTFKMIDADGSGSITFEELKVGLKKLGSGLMENELQILMEAVCILKSGLFRTCLKNTLKVFRYP